MAGGQQVNSGQGSVTPSETFAPAGQQINLAQGAVSSGGAPTNVAISGSASTGGTGTAPSAMLIGLRSRKVGGGAAIQNLVGQASTPAAGSMIATPTQSPVGQAVSTFVGTLGPVKSLLLVGSAAAMSAGSMSIPGVSGAPLILYTDITAGPTTGGENNKGCYLSIFGLNLGAFSDYGTLNHVTIGGVEVDNYRCITTAIGGTAHRWAALAGVQRLVVQVGAIGSPAAGVALPINVMIGGVNPINAKSGSVLLMPTLKADLLTFTPQPGAILFVDPVNGSDANAGTFASPLLSLQTSSNGGAFKQNTSVNAGNGIVPGTHVVCRSGTSTVAGMSGRGVDLNRITGTPATGAASRGPIVCTVYPGAAGANAPESFTWQGGAGVGGAFNGNSSARAQETSTLYGGFTGWCQDIHLCNMHLISNPTAPGDGGVINMQSSAMRWRQVNNEYEWRSTVTGTNHPKSGGSEGSSVDSRIFGPYCHDIYGDTSAMENHGFYFDGNIVVTTNMEIAFFTIENIPGGNGIQTFDGVNGAGMTLIDIHNGWIKTCGKNNLNLVDNTKSIRAWNIVMQGAGEYGVRWSGTSVGANGFYLGNCTIYNWDTTYTAADRDAVFSGNTYSGGGSGRMENLICMQPSTHPTGNYSFAVFDESGGSTTIRNCQWFDARSGGLTTKPAADTTGAYGNPLFTNAAGGDFTLQAGSPCLNSGVAPTVINRVYDVLMLPAGGTPDRGAFEYTSVISLVQKSSTLAQPWNPDTAWQAPGFATLAGVAAGNLLVTMGGWWDANHGPGGSQSLPTDSNGTIAAGSNPTLPNTAVAWPVHSQIGHTLSANAGTHNVTPQVINDAGDGYFLIAEFTGSGTAWTKIDSGSAFSDSATPGAINGVTVNTVGSTAQVGDLVIAVVVTDGNPTAIGVGPAAGHTSLLTTATTTNNVSVGAGWKLVTVAGTQTASWVWADNDCQIGSATIAVYRRA